MNVKTLKNEVQLKLELNAMAQPAVDAADEARAAAGNANAAANRVDEAIALAQRAAQHAQDTADSVNGAAARAETATATANTAADAANNAASRTQSAIENAQYAATSANNAASQASAAASNATAAMKTANNAASLANAAATSANHAAEDALAAAGAANNAANDANAAAKTASDMTNALENVHPQAVAATEAANAAAQNANTAAQNASAAVNKVVSDGNAAIESAKDVAADTLAAGEAVRSIYEVKADAIIDTSTKAASHSLHAQDGPLAVTLYGQTTETGTGDKSPDNPYVISGVDAARVHSGGKNLLPLKGGSHNGATATVEGDGIRVSGTASGNSRIFLLGTAIDKGVILPPGTYTLSLGRSDETYAIRAYNANTSKQLAATGGTFTLAKPTPVSVFLYASSGQVITEQVVYPMLEIGSTATAYEPYTANVINPPLLPDGAPLHGNGTVYDTVENDVLSGCDKCVVFDGSPDENWFLDAVGVREAFRIDDEVLANRVDRNAANNDGEVSYLYSNQLTTEKYSTVSKEGIGASMRGTNYNGSFIVMYPAGTFGTVDAFRAHLAANPLTVFYRSTEYTPENDLRVCKTVRRKACRRITGDEVKGPITANGYTAFRFGLKDTKPEANRLFIMSHFTEKWACNPGNFRNNFGNDYNVELVISEDITTIEAAKAWFDENNVYAEYNLATPETYMTDPLDLRKPTGMEKVTVTGSGETAVTYPHDTKHYIDQKFDALAAALLS